MPEVQDLAPEAGEARRTVRRAALPLAIVGAGMSCCHILVEARDVVFVKGLVEAHEGLAGVFAERGGELMLAAPASRAAELAELVRDLVDEGVATRAGGALAEAGQ